MDTEQIIQKMKERGYILHSSNGTEKSFDFVDENGIYVSVALNNDEWFCQLSFTVGLLTVSTQPFDFNHPLFEKLFEQQIINAFVRLNN